MVGALLEFLDNGLEIAKPGNAELEQIVALTVRMLRASKAVSQCLSQETQQKVNGATKALVAKTLMVMNLVHDCQEDVEKSGEVRSTVYRDYKRSLDEMGDIVQEIVEAMKQK